MMGKMLQVKRSAVLVFTVFVFFIANLFAFVPAPVLYAQSEDAVQNLRAPHRTENQLFDSGDIYSALASGKRIMQERAYDTPERPAVYLTFDDGPSALTAQVLDILRDEEVKATFFALGEQAKAHPETIKRIVSEGHALGNHTYNHVYKELYSNFSSFWSQVQKSEAVFFDIAGVRPRMIRAPGGTYANFDAFYFYYLDRAGYTVFDWTIDSGDSQRRGVPAQEIVNRVKKGPFGQEVIVLMHDGSGHAETVKALREIIRLFKEKGYDFAVLSDKVKPVMFSLGKLKWEREAGMAAFRGHLALLAGRIQEQRSQPADGGVDQDGGKYESNLAYQNQVSVTESVYALAQKQNTPTSLSLWLDGKKVEFSPNQYQFRDERLYVPLRLLVEDMGGRVYWNDAERTAVADYGFYHAEYNFSDNTLTLSAPGRSASVVHFPEMRIENGMLIVPLRNTLEMFGNDIKSYNLSWNEREVKAGLYPGFVLAAVAEPEGTGRLPAVADGTHTTKPQI